MADLRAREQEFQLLEVALDRKRAALEEVAHHGDAGRWASVAPATEHGTERLYEALEARMARPEFAEELARSAHEAVAQPPPPAGGGEVMRDDWWSLQPDGGVSASVPEATGDYVVVERDDVVDALAAFIAAYIVSLPEARQMEPRELQAAVVGTMHELRKGRMRRLWDWGRCFYRAGVVAYSAFSMFSNPWVAKAVLAALWTALRWMGAAAAAFL